MDDLKRSGMREGFSPTKDEQIENLPACSRGACKSEAAETNNGWISRSERLPTQEDGDSRGCVFAWHAYQGVMLTRWDSFPGNRFNAYWMRIEDNPHGTWIDAMERKPTQEDADSQNCVHVRNEHGESLVTGYHQFGWNRALVSWQRLPEPPSDHRELRKRL